MENQNLTHALLMEIKTDIKAVSEKLEHHISDPKLKEAHEYTSLCMVREGRREKLYQAITEKSLAGLVYAMVVSVFIAIGAYVKAHWVF